MLFDMLMPLHPAHSTRKNAKDHRRFFQFNRTKFTIDCVMPLAIANLRPKKPAGTAPQPYHHLIKRHHRQLVARLVLIPLCALFTLLDSTAEPSTAKPQTTETNSPSRLQTPADFAASAKKNFWDANVRYHHRNHDSDDTWHFARACFDLADFATNDTERAEIAEQGIAACQSLLQTNANSVEGHYYLGMNYGQLAQTKSLGALKLVDQMEHEFGVVRGIDPYYDYAGADRNLGLLYRDAPAIGSIGSRTKARQHLQKAVDLAGDYPENRLNLIEACLKWNDRVGARRELKALEELWPKAQAKLVGNAWAASWYDWQNRLDKVKKKIEESSRTIESPRKKD